MIRGLRKWWALRVFTKESDYHGISKLSALQLSLGARFKIAEEAIIFQIVRDSLDRFSWVIKDKTKREKELSACYSSIFQEAKKEGLVYQIPDNQIVDNLEIQNPPGRPWISPTYLGDKYIADFWWRILFGNHYSKAIITAVVIALAGLYINHIFQNTFKEINSPPVVNVYPDIILPEMKPTINPIINVYPNK